MKKILVSTVLSTLTLAQAQAGDDRFESTVITATRTPLHLNEAFESISVYERVDIERLQAVDVFDLLDRAPGVSFVRNGGRGGATGLMIRGHQSDHSLFLIDGVRIGSATLGSATLSALSTSLVERVEIIRGPKSALWGADALGGVVNLITRAAPEQGARLDLTTSFGSNDTRETTAVAGFATDSSSLNLVASHFNTEGIDHTENTDGVNGDDDAFRNTSLALFYRQELGEAVELGMNYSRNDGENEYDSACLDNTAFVPVDCLIYSEALVEALSASLDYRVSDFYSGGLRFGRSKDESRNLADYVDLSTTFSGGEFNTEKTEATWLNQFNLMDSQQLTLGFDYQLDEVDSTTDYDEDSRDNKAAFAQLQSDWQAINTLLGVRYDDNEQFGSATTVSALVGWEINDHWRAYVSYGEGFKPPTFNDLYFPGFGNPEFEPEESQSVELGIKAQWEQFSLSAAVFNNDIENLIQFNSATFVTDQTARAEVSGLEFSMLGQWQTLSAELSGTVLDPENKVTELLLPRRAERSLTLDVDYAWQRFAAGLTLRAESERYDDAANTQRLAGYSTLNLRTRYQLNEQWRIEARVDNVFDRRYAAARDFSLGRFLAIGREAHISIHFSPAF